MVRFNVSLSGKHTIYYIWFEIWKLKGVLPDIWITSMIKVWNYINNSVVPQDENSEATSTR